MKLFTLTAFFSIASVDGCSRVFENKYDRMVSGRSMDWAYSFDDVLFLYPRGQIMDGNDPNGNSVQWTSKYSSVVSSIIGHFEELGLGPGEQCENFDFYHDGGTDGVNEMGLGAHVLYLGTEDGTAYAESTKWSGETGSLGNLSYLRWVRFVLDNFATVAEAVEGLKSVTTVAAQLCFAYDEDGVPLELGAHMAIEDALGDSAIFEHVGGSLQVYHGPDTLVMTNEPSFDQQQELLKQYEPWGGDIILPDGLPGSVASEDRFVRLEYYINYSPEPTNEAEAVAFVKSLIGTTNVPFGAPYNGGIYPTWWESIIDLTNSVYYFNWLLTPNIVWTDIKEADEMGLLEEGNPILYLRPQDTDLVGNVLCDYTTEDGMFPCKGIAIAEA